MKYGSDRKSIFEALKNVKRIVISLYSPFIIVKYGGFIVAVTKLERTTFRKIEHYYNRNAYVVLLSL